MHIDPEGNAVGFLITQPKQKKLVLLSAHADTACDAPPPIKVKDDGKYLYAHGICDNTAGVTALLTFLRFVHTSDIPLKKNYLIAFTVGEEGLGAKRGMKRIIADHGKNVSYVVNIESHDIGRVTNACVGQYRARLSVITKQKGAHSWRNFGESNAVVILSSIIHDLSKLRLSEGTTYNITAFQGGKSINSIPSEAHCLLEFRAKEQKNIDTLLRRLENFLHSEQNANVKCKLDVLAVTEAASFPDSHSIFEITQRAQNSLGIKPFFKTGNTDGDVTLARNIPTVTLGASNGFATHSLEEKMEIKTYLRGIEQVIEVILALDREMGE
ncbi:MAG: M20/M25/M40 family metallo-hydrolase [Candidatus Peregrinibacteria bacterium]